MHDESCENKCCENEHAGQSRAGQGRAGQGRAGQGRADAGLEVLRMNKQAQHTRPMSCVQDHRLAQKALTVLLLLCFVTAGTGCYNDAAPVTRTRRME